MQQIFQKYMKMKRVTLGFSILALSTAFVLSCKPDKDVAPTADTEVQSSVYASWANFVITDIEMACSFMAENNYAKTYYSAYPASGTTVTVQRDTVLNGGNEDKMSMSWNNTKCIDGNVRSGSIYVYVPQGTNTGENIRYSRNYKWKGRIDLQAYKINGWIVKLYDSLVPAYLFNTIPSINYAPAGNLTWRFAGKLKFIHPTDPKKNMVWDGELFKTLENTSDVKVFPSKNTAINWMGAVLSYYGHFEGTGPRVDANDNVIAADAPYKMKINPETHLIRDTKCSPDKVTGVAFTATVTSLEQYGSEFHPFKSGVASFTVGTDYPRQIYYGNENEPTLTTPQCDNAGEVMIKGISYRVDFMK